MTGSVQPGSSGSPGQVDLRRGTVRGTKVVDRADQQGVPAYLEATSPDNRRLYERHGFVVTGELSILGGPPVWPMWRGPRR